MKKILAVISLMLLLNLSFISAVEYKSVADISKDLCRTIYNYNRLQEANNQNITRFSFVTVQEMANTLFMLKYKIAHMRIIKTHKSSRGSSGGGSNPEPTAEPIVIMGDADGDGKVTQADYGIWVYNYDAIGQNENTFENGDFNEDGKVDGGDLSIWQSNYNP